MSTSQIISKDCKNCGHPVSEKFCPNCGQKTKTDRFDWKHIGHQILDSIDLDRGFIHTLYLIIINPGNSIRRFILGSRIGFANPFKLFLIIGAFTNFLTYEYDFFSQLTASPPDLYDVEGYFRYSTKYFSFFTFTGIPLFSVFSWIAFYKRPYNLIEHYILNLYIGVGQFLIIIVFIPVLEYSKVEEFIWVYGALNFIYNLWVLMTFFRTYSLKSTMKIILAILIPIWGSFYYNYFIYRLSPQSLWEFLDRVLA